MTDKLRDPVSALTHLFSAAVALIGVIVLLALSDKTTAWILSLSVYGASLVMLFLASGTCRSVRSTPRVIELFRKLDHSAIYLLIAGSYTPFCVNAFSGFWRWACWPSSGRWPSPVSSSRFSPCAPRAGLPPGSTLRWAG